MKKTISLILLSMAFLPQALSQISDNPKLSIDPQLTLIDVTNNLGARLSPGSKTIRKCCQGLRLVAEVQKGKGRDAGKNVITKWHVFDASNTELKGDIGERELASNNHAIETVIVLRELGYGFIVGRRPR